MTLRYIVDVRGYNGKTEDLALRIRYTDQTGEEKTVELTEGQTYGAAEEYYSFDFNELLAAELRCVLKAAVYAGDVQLSNTMEYSIDTYGNHKTGALGELCKALFAYSDSARAYFS